METILIFIGVLLLLIIVHELGHFLSAKWTGMKVLEFGIGFPPKIFGKKFSEDGTEYTLNWFPLGGFVRILGEDEKEAEDPRAFSNKPAWKQALVLFAGPFANILLAVVLSTIALMLGTLSSLDESNREDAHDARVLVVEVLPESPAAIAGVQIGDEIRGFETPSAFSSFIKDTEGSVTLTLYRNGIEREVTLSPTVGLIAEDPERPVVGLGTALVGTVAYPLHEAVWLALVDTTRDFVLILVSLLGLIGSALTLSADISQLAGPVGIATLTGDAASLGVGALLSFAAILSVNLAVINLLPFPALDGGRLLFLGVETVTRRKIPLKTAAAVNTVGFVMLILLMIAVTIGDITRLLG